jgi:hypothetical protein
MLGKSYAHSTLFLRQDLISFAWVIFKLNSPASASLVAGIVDMLHYP